MITPVIPALDLIGGAVVRLHQGDYHQTTRYDRDPAALIAAYREQGAQQIHLVDLDGAKDPAQRQTALIARLAASARCPIQVGGGIRSADDIAALLAAGANRVVIGSLAVEQPDTVKAWLARFGGERIVLALAVRPHDGAHYLAVRGWQDTSTHTLETLLEHYRDSGLRHILCTDIRQDGTLQGANTALYRELHRAWPQLAIQASGGIGSLDDIRALKDSGVAGIITGRALLEGEFTLTEALQCWQNA